MGTIVYAILDYAVSFGGSLLLIAPFLRREWRRKDFPFRVLICSLGALMLIFAIAPFSISEVYEISYYFTYTALCVYVYVFVFACYRLRAPALIFVGFYGVVLQQTVRLAGYLVAALWEMAGLAAYDSAVALLVRVIVSALLYALLRGLGIYRTDINSAACSLRMSVLFVVCGAGVMLFAAFTGPVLAYGTAYYTFFLLCEIAACAIVLLGLTSVIRETILSADNAILESLLKEDRAQYETMKESMELLNIMCHDMKHGLIRGADTQTAEALSKYDSFMQTGNQALDIVLTEKGMAFSKCGIMFTCVADGSALDFMDRGDVYALFGNALDNAAEYLAQVEEENRFVDVSLRREGSFVVLRIENYLREPLAFSDGFPCTTKTDGGLHGYGVKSIARIAKKYGGTMKIKCEDGMFQLEIVFLEIPEQAGAIAA